MTNLLFSVTSVNSVVKLLLDFQVWLAVILPPLVGQRLARPF